MDLGSTAIKNNGFIRLTTGHINPLIADRAVITGDSLLFSLLQIFH